MSLEQQNHFIELGKQLQEKNARQERFNDNFSILEERFNFLTKDIKIKTDFAYTKPVSEITEYIDNNSEEIFDDNELDYILYSKFIKHKLKLADKEISKLKDEIDDLDTMNNTYVEELEEKDSEIKLLENQKEFYKNNYDNLGYFLTSMFIFLFINFVGLYFIGSENFDMFWGNIFSEIFNFIKIIIFIMMYYWLEFTTITGAVYIIHYIYNNYFYDTFNKND